MIVALPATPPLVAVIVAVPIETAVTTPLNEIVATPSLLEVQVTSRPLSTLLLASRAVAVACVVCPTLIDVDARDTATEATGICVTLTDEMLVFPSLVAVIVTGPPTVWPVTSPFASTDATARLFDDQVTARPVSVLLLPSLVSAVSC